MKKVSVLLVLALAVFALTTMLAYAEGGPTYVGDAKCKGCHKDVHTAWAETGHAKAFTVLSAEEQKDPKCVSCHITGKDATGAVLEGVQCEACHGPGSDYKSAKIMSKKKWAADPEAQKKMAIEAGLIYPTAENCQSCHKEEGNPNFKPFDFEKSKAKVHPVKAEG